LNLKWKANLKLPSMIKGWFNPNIKPDLLLDKYAQSGDQKALTKLIELYNRDLFHFLLSQSDRATAEDSLQNTWIKVMKNAGQYKLGTSVRNWLFTIARHTLIDELRRLNRWHTQVLSEHDLSSVTLSEEIITKDKLTLFNHIVSQLPFYQREAFILQQEGFSLHEIAIMTDEKQETIKSRIRYAKQNIRSTLENKL